MNHCPMCQYDARVPSLAPDRWTSEVCAGCIQEMQRCTECGTKLVTITDSRSGFSSQVCDTYSCPNFDNFSY